LQRPASRVQLTPACHVVVALHLLVVLVTQGTQAQMEAHVQLVPPEHTRVPQALKRAAHVQSTLVLLAVHAIHQGVLVIQGTLVTICFQCTLKPHVQDSSA
jgi:hypothetical protein